MKVSFTASIKGALPQWERVSMHTCLSKGQRYNSLGDNKV